MEQQSPLENQRPAAVRTDSLLSDHSRLQGLTVAEVAASRVEHGSNVLTLRERTPWWRKLAVKFADPLIVILIVAALLSIAISVYEYVGLHADVTVFFEPVGIIIAIALATGMAFWFEQKADSEFALLNQYNDHESVRVIRDGRETEIERSEVVVGDIVMLSVGDEIPADGQLIKATQMQVDESSLTGEPVCRKSTLADEMDADATYPTDFVLRGTKLLEGHGLMRVTAVGDATEAGHVFTEVQIDSSVRTPLNEQLDRLGLFISRASYAIAAGVVIGRIVMWVITNGQETIDGAHSTIFNFEFLTYILQSLMLAVTLIVVAVPEGLPMTVTLSLAYSMRRMLRTNNLVRRMHACETMGAATVICTDKTGTLTQNQMRVSEIRFAEGNEHQSAVITNIAVNSTAALDGASVIGNPTEGALLLWLREQGVDYRNVRAEAPFIEEIPFSTERKYMATRVHDTLYIKGAPEIVFGMCQTDVPEYLGEWQQRGLRTLALAHAEKSGRPVADALVAIADPVRADVPAAIAECRQASIDVKIVTGDTAATAAEIARQIGLLEGRNAFETATVPPDSAQGRHLILTGPEVSAMTDEQLQACAKDIAIIARARPAEKQRLVGTLQALGEVVAVTGDGTNDAPALKAAHVGLSMGDGTAVAKEASDITILDNSFSSIGRAVLWGRSLYRNIQRFILFQMTVNVCACLTVLAGAFMGTDAPLTVTQMLWVNLIMDTFAAMALASLPPTSAVMRERPRDRRKFIISRPMWRFIMGIGGLFFLFMTGLLWLFEHAEVDSVGSLISLLQGVNNHVRHSHLSPYELSFFFTTFVMLQFWNLFNARAFLTRHSAFDLRGCREFLAIVAVIFFGQLLIVGLGGRMFNVVPLDFTTWLFIILGTAPVMLVGEVLRKRH